MGAAGVVVLGLLASLAEGMGVGLLIRFSTSCSATPARLRPGFTGLMQEIAAQVGEQLRLVVLCLGILCLISLKVLVVWANVGLAAWLNSNVARDLRVALFNQLLRVRYGFVASADQGHLVNVLAGQTIRIGQALMVLEPMASACTVFVFGLLLFLISWPLTLIVVTGVVLVSLFVRMMARRAVTTAMLRTRPRPRSPARSSKASLSCAPSVCSARISRRRRAPSAPAARSSGRSCAPRRSQASSGRPPNCSICPRTF